MAKRILSVTLGALLSSLCPLRTPRLKGSRQSARSTAAGACPGPRRGLVPGAFPLMIAAGVLGSGCMLGPRWSDELRLDLPPDAARGKTVVVSGFQKMVSASSTTGSAEIIETKESVQVHDISGAVAEALRTRGVSAEARKDVKPAYLHENEVLLSGAVLTQERVVNVGKLVPAAFLSALSFGILPTPVPFEEARAVVYRVELVDRRGRILYQSGDQRLVGSFDSYHIFGSANAQEEVPRRLADDLSDKLMVALAEGLRSSDGAVAAPLEAGSPAEDELGEEQGQELAEAYRWFDDSQRAREERCYDEGVASAEKALLLAEGHIGQENMELERFVVNCGLQYVERARANSLDAVDLERARGSLVRAYRIRAHELGRDDVKTRQLEEYLTNVYGTDAVRQAQNN